MKLIVLPGNSKKANEQWLTDSAASFSEAFTEVHAQRYAHWDTGNKLIDLPTELNRLSELLKNESSYHIYAKSAGTALSAMGMAQNILKPEKCVFVGLPLRWAKENNVPLLDWLKQINIPVEIVQQTEDPEGAFAEVKELITELGKAELSAVEITGNDHRYDDFSLIREPAEKFFKKPSHDGGEIKFR